MRLYIYPANTSIGFPWAPNENWKVAKEEFIFLLLSSLAAVHGKNTGVWFRLGFLSVGAARWNQMDMQRSTSSERRSWNLFCVSVYIDGFHSRGMETALMEELLDGRHRQGRAAPLVTRIKTTPSRLWQPLGHVLGKLGIAQHWCPAADTAQGNI